MRSAESEATGQAIPRATVHGLARRALFGFLVTFIIARICVFLIMTGSVPNMYLFMHGTHVHHLNYGIFLLSFVAGYSVFRRPTGRGAQRTALAYGVAMGLTFDEFGMWLNLGGSYWQRASVDAVIVVAGVFALVGFARSLERYEKRHCWACAVLCLTLIGFGVVLFKAGNSLGGYFGPDLRALEQQSSP